MTGPGSPTAYWCEHAWLPDGVTPDVLVRVGTAGVITTVSTGATPPGAVRLPGVVLPGFANAHSHAFHRALRGRTHAAGGTFWTWRDAMYSLAERLDPDGYLRLARAVYAEMALAGVACVGEFHYLHHGPGGARYADPNAMAAALRQAAAEAGIRLTLLDACYLAGGIGSPVDGVQLRFSDGCADAWATRVAELAEDAAFRVGAAVHSVRAVPAEALPCVVSGAPPGRPLHVHLSEQPAENAACLAAHGRTPAELLHEAGAVSARTTAVHATHLREGDIGLLGAAGATACLCPTTEADLADGIGPARELADAGCALALGSDQHAVVDPLVEARALEHGERLRTGRRGRFTPAELVAASTRHGHASLGWPEAGRIAAGSPADLVAVRLDSPRTAGVLPEQVLLAATASDVDTVVVGGRVVASGGRHVLLGDVGRLLADAIEELWR
jgi:formiminoglutamate deiminase